MPHVIVEYSANVEGWVDLQGFCERLRTAAIDTGVFALSGVRVRAVKCELYSIADGRDDRGFVDISVRLRGGRPLETRKDLSEKLFGASRDYLAEALEQHALAISLEVREIDPELSPKASSIHRHVE